MHNTPFRNQVWQEFMNLLHGVMQEHPPLDKCRLYPVLSNDKVSLYVECPSNCVEEAWRQRYALLGVAHSARLSGGCITYLVDGDRYDSVKITAENAIALTNFVVRQDFIPTLPLHPELIHDLIDERCCLPALLVFSDHNWNEVNIRYKLASCQSFFVSQQPNKSIKFFKVRNILQFLGSETALNNHTLQQGLCSFQSMVSASLKVIRLDKVFIPVFNNEVSIYLLLSSKINQRCSN
jgi:hypothetical protein